VTSSFDQLRADIAESDPAAVLSAVDEKADEFLRACVRFARTMQLSDDPWLGMRHLINAMDWVNHAQVGLHKEIEIKVKSKGIGIG